MRKNVRNLLLLVVIATFLTVIMSGSVFAVKIAAVYPSLNSSGVKGIKANIFTPVQYNISGIPSGTTVKAAVFLINSGSTNEPQAGWFIQRGTKDLPTSYYWTFDQNGNLNSSNLSTQPWDMMREYEVSHYTGSVFAIYIVGGTARGYTYNNNSPKVYAGGKTSADNANLKAPIRWVYAKNSSNAWIQLTPGNTSSVVNSPPLVRVSVNDYYNFNVRNTNFAW